MRSLNAPSRPYRLTRRRLDHRVLVAAVEKWCEEHPQSCFTNATAWMGACVVAMDQLYSPRTSHYDRCYGVVKIAATLGLLGQPAVWDSFYSGNGGARFRRLLGPWERYATSGPKVHAWLQCKG